MIFTNIFSKKKKVQLKAAEQVATRTHRENIEKIVNARESADDLVRVLRKNHITIQIKRALQ